MERPPFKRKADNDEDAPRKTQKPDFAKKLMERYGWKAGTGLGASAQGRANIIEVNLRPQRAGLGAVREGKSPDPSDEERATAKEAKKKPKGPKPATRPAAKKYSVQMLEDAGITVPAALKYVDAATGLEKDNLSLRGGVSFQTEGQGLAQRALRDTQSYADALYQVTEQAKDISFEENSLQEQLDILEAEIRSRQRTIAALYSSRENSTFEANVDLIERLQEEGTAIDEETIVSVLRPLFAKEMDQWEVLETPLESVAAALGRVAPRAAPGPTDKIQHDLVRFGLAEKIPIRKSKNRTTPMEGMLATLWLPKVRSALISGSFDTHEPAPILTVIDTWKQHGLLPPWIVRTIVSQMTEKLKSEIHSINVRKSVKKSKLPISHVLLYFPYLEDAELRPQEPNSLLNEVKRKVSAFLALWPVQTRLPQAEILRSLLGSTLDDVVVKSLVPRLSEHIRTLVIDPTDQQMEPLLEVLQHDDLVQPKIMAEIIMQLFDSFHQILHAWLVSDTVDFTEVGAWYTWWRSQLPEAVNNAPQVQREWDKAIKTIHTAMDLGDRIKTDLPAPDTEQEEPMSAPPLETESRSARKPAVEELTFRDIVEAFCSEESLLLIPLKEAHESTGLPLWRITASASGRGGVVVYFKGDFIFARQKGDKSSWEPIGLGEGLIQRAEGK